MEIRRVKLLLVGGLLASGGIAILAKDIQNQLHGNATSAKVLELKSECFVSRLQASQNKWSRETIDCAAEPELKRALGSDKNVEVMRYDSAMIEFPLQDGSLFKTEVSQQPYTRSSPLHVGDSLAVIYDPKSPRNARAPLGLLDVCVSLAIFAFGALCIFFALKFNVKRSSDSGIKPDAGSRRTSPPDMRTAKTPPVSQSRMALATGKPSRSAQSGFGRR